MRTALLGCGKVGHTHAQAFASLPQSEFVAVCDADESRARSFAGQYGVQAYPDLPSLLADAGIGLLSVCTPHPTHADAIVTAAAGGAHVLVEKPLAPDLQGCDSAIAACRSAGTRLGVISQRRLYPPVARLRAAIDAGKIGEPILATMSVLGWRGEDYYAMDAWRGRWATEGGGVLVNQTVHQLDLFQWLMGPILEVSAFWDNLNHPFVEVEDTAVAIVRFRSGALGQLVVSNSQNPGLGGNIHIHGSNGASIGAQTEGSSPFIAGVTAAVEPAINDIWTVPGEEAQLAEWQREDRALAESIDPMAYFHRLQIEDMLEAVLEDRDPMVPGEEGRKSVELFTAIYRSQRDHGAIRLPLEPEDRPGEYDGRLTHDLLSRRRSQS